MIIVRSPLRVSLLGGGSDFSSFYTYRNGVVVSFALDKYIYITINKLVETNDILIKYSKLERVQNINHIQHPIIRAVLQRFELKGIDISVSSDIPAGTGLGSSSSFTVGLLKSVSEYKGINLSKADLAKIACEIEIEDLKEPIGKQDQYSASFGGINHFVFHQNGDVASLPLLGRDLLETQVTQCCLLLRIGTVRQSSSILTDQSEKLNRGINLNLIDGLVDIAEKFCSKFPESVTELGSFLTESWRLKVRLADGITNSEIEGTLETAIKFGAKGGKLLGAGKSGYILLVFGDYSTRGEFINQHSDKFVIILPRVDSEGCKVIFRSE